MRWLIVALLLTACGAAQTTTQPINVTLTPVPTVPLVIPTAETPEATTEAAPSVVHLWWPELLMPNDSLAAETLAEQIEAFQAANPDLSVEVRLKRVGDIGGIMSTLRTAWAVAPGALPDLTLVRRSDLVVAERAGLIRVLQGNSSELLTLVYPSAAALGQVNGERYGIPYLLEVEHLAYHPGASVPEGWRFADVLAADMPLTFPVGRPGSLNSLFAVQYMQMRAGDDLATPDPNTGITSIDADALLRLFSFYEQASAAGLIDPLVLETSNANDYIAELEAGGVPAAMVSSSQYLRLLGNGADLAAAPPPTESGEPISVIDGWMWVIPTPNTDRQHAAARLLNWMMDAERQSDFARALAMLPSQAAALRLWNEQGEPLSGYATFIEPLLVNAILLPGDEAFGGAGRAIQAALAGVLSGQFTAQQAVDAVLAQAG